MFINTWWEDVKKMEPGSFQLPSDSTRGNRHTLKHILFKQQKTHFFTVRVTKQGIRLLREVVEFSSVEIFKT